MVYINDESNQQLLTKTVGTWAKLLIILQKIKVFDYNLPPLFSCAMLAVGCSLLEPLRRSFFAKIVNGF